MYKLSNKDQGRLGLRNSQQKKPAVLCCYLGELVSRFRSVSEFFLCWWSILSRCLWFQRIHMCLFSSMLITIFFKMVSQFVTTLVIWLSICLYSIPIDIFIIYSIYSHVQRSVISRKSVIMMIQLSLGVLPSQHTIIPVTTRRQYHFRVRRDL